MQQALTPRYIVAQGYLSGSSRYQNEWVESMDRLALRRRIRPALVCGCATMTHALALACAGSLLLGGTGGCETEKIRWEGELTHRTDSSDAGEQQGETANQGGGPVSLASSKHEKYLLPAIAYVQEWRRQCREGGGRWTSAEQCECTVQEGPGTFSAGYGCAAAVVRANTCTEMPSGFSRALQGDRATFQDCLDHSAFVPLLTHGKGTPQIRFSADSKHESQLASWADLRLRQGAVIPARFWSGTALTDVLKVYMGELDGETVDTFLKYVFYPEIVPDKSHQFTVPILAANAAELDNIFFGSPFSSHAHRFATVRGEDREIIQVLATASEIDVRKWTWDWVDDVEEAGAEACAHVCRLYSNPHPLSGFFGVLERNVINGSVARELVWLYDTNGVRGVVGLGPSGRPNYYVTVLNPSTQLEVGKRLSVYDSQGTLAGSKTVAYEFGDAPIPKPFELAHDGLPRLGLCEGNLEVLLEPAFREHLLIGPKSSAGGGPGSFFGWWSNPSGTNLAANLAGLSQVSFGSVPALDSVADMDRLHGRRVVKAALAEVENLRILPLGGIQCFDGLSAWRDNARPHMRVINASLGMFAARGTCQHRWGATLDASREDFLWVMPAGNEHDLAPWYECVGNISGRANLLVVAGSDGDGLSLESNYGVEYADLAAPSKSEGAAGTSYAAPRVAAVAAELARRSPRLRPEELRAALLLGAHVTRDLWSQVRAGGTLDAVKSADLAACLAEGLHEGPHQALDAPVLKKCLLRGGTDPREAQVRMDRLLGGARQ